VHYLVSLLVSELYMAGLALSPSVGWVLVLGRPEVAGFGRVLEMGITNVEGAANKPLWLGVGCWQTHSIVGGLQV